VEVNDPREHFASLGRPTIVTVSDGSGGTLTAALGTRSPTMDGYGQLTFFWHDRQFLGFDSRFEAVAVATFASGGPGEIVVRYGHYAPHDAYCCPSLAPVAVTYRWGGERLVVDGREPLFPGLLVPVKLLG